MTFEEIADRASKLIEYQNAMPAPSYSNYKQVLAAYKSILNDVLVMTRELAQNLVPAEPPLEAPGVELPAELNPFAKDEIAP